MSPCSRLRALLAPALLLAPLVASAGCRTTEELEPSAAGALVSVAPLDITLAQSLRRWKETPTSPGRRVRFRLGELFLQLFPGHDGRAFLSPVETHLEADWSGSARAWVASYTFVLSLQLDGVHHEIRAAGEGRSDGDPRAAERAALEDCVEDIYARAASLLTRKGTP